MIDFSIIITLHLVKELNDHHMLSNSSFFFSWHQFGLWRPQDEANQGEEFHRKNFLFPRDTLNSFQKTEINLTSTCGNICNITNISHFVKAIPVELFSNLKENSSVDYLMIIAQTDWCCNLLYPLHDIKGASMITPPFFVWYRLYRYWELYIDWSDESFLHLQEDNFGIYSQGAK